MTAIAGSRINRKKSQKALNKLFWKKIVPPLVALAIFLVIWQLLCLNPNFKLPGPIETVSETWNPFIINPFFDNGESDKGLGWQILSSLGRVGLGFSLATIVGIALGILIGANQLVYNAVDPIFQVLRTVPPLAWLPISLAAFQQANPSAIFVIFITSIWPIIINTTVGVQQIPQDYINVAKVLKLKGPKYFFKIVFPATVPYIFTGLRIGIGLSWLAIVAAEMLVGGVGIGSFIWDAYNTTTETNMSEIIIALIYVGLVGLMLDRLVAFIASKVVAEQK
ncbi:MULTISPECIES: nitrate ABC transporter permease [unclassified Tolypothrix]|uniref:nitrate ABC transporter permease n=1 Tax=unclassified Tolypothrix TaxID=2649714 RepID=UPI0005EAAAC3|nr:MULTISPECIES: nitrate ABC transporter permease [unclassified Tolypothrix]BAY93585.1 nitrate transport permease [Microchaete diplosiphon NIES-3275]EKE99628.1 nitrate ABC transporter, permease protein [Tolypothrix sp. PCC 7601]MBE9082408.1 nitrate ABC transporter permease [Tolypothrix sp. LEGE 11397]UYD27412.1 nitrate ABC transporter permease [Tolypothrix sp. PCC 7712]UYD36723.1 nitrate ABC transporter permease [Tolypothrix sp. PCC 7601]